VETEVETEVRDRGGGRGWNRVGMTFMNGLTDVMSQYSSYSTSIYGPCW
jgi:hypothetical protein